MAQNLKVARNIGNIAKRIQIGFCFVLFLVYHSVECQTKSLSNLCFCFICLRYFLLFWSFVQSNDCCKVILYPWLTIFATTTLVSFLCLCLFASQILFFNPSQWTIASGCPFCSFSDLVIGACLKHFLSTPNPHFPHTAHLNSWSPATQGFNRS